MRCVLTTWLLALLIVCGVAVAAIEDDSRWPRFIRDPNAQVCLGVPLIDDLKDGTATIRCVYRLVLTPQDGAASKPIWGVVTLTASARRDADRRCVHFNDFKVAALSAATMDAADAPMASQWLTTVLSMAPLMIDERELLASLPDHTLPAAKDAGEGSLEEREAALLACLPVLPALPALPVLPAPAADATAAPASQRCTDESFGDPYVGRGNWIHRLREGRWERWSPEHGWVDAHIALEFPAGAPWSMQKDTFELLRARAAATTAGMRRDPRTLEDARARRFEANLRTASQTVSTTQTLFRAPVFPE